VWKGADARNIVVPVSFLSMERAGVLSLVWV
jgi:hypothetical protein